MSVFWKQFLSSFIIILLVLTLFTSLVISELNKYDVSVTKQRLTTTANLVSDVIKPELSSHNIGGLQTIVSKLGNKTGIRITVVANNGKVLADSQKNPGEMGNHSKRPEILQALSNNEGKSSRYSTTLQTEMIYVAVPFEDKSGGVPYVIRTALPLNIVQQALLPIEKKVVYLGIILTLIALVLSLLISKTTTQSLHGIINISEELARGNLNIDIPNPNKKGEIAKITNALHKMAQKLNELFKQLSREKNQLEAVLSAMREGVVVISGEGKIMITNSALKNMFNIKEDPHLKPYWEILRNKDLINLVEKVLQNWVPETMEISHLYPDERYYLANVIPLDSPENEIIVVMFDITEFKRLENMKADFIANVSHELRTPLTAIKGYTETLEEDAYESPQEKKQFLSIVKRNADRLINIVSDLLVLSEIESRDSLSRETVNTEFENVNVNEVITSSLESLKSKAANKNITINYHPIHDIDRIKADRFLLEQMFINLVDNAIKYTSDGGDICIDMSATDTELAIEINDTGIGIPKEHLPRIFERFYRVDTTRSRKMGGTGLGLSIVKHIVIMHSGKIDVESEEGKGSKFTINLPI